MRSKKQIVILLVGLTILIGGVYMRNFFTGEEITQEMLIQEEQERMALYLVNHYEDVKKIEFLSFEKNDVTGTWKSVAIVNEDIYVKFTLWGEYGEIGVSQLLSRNGGKSLQKRNKSENFQDVRKLEIIYKEK